jgi:GNAT superfamily N-acetyltransferase
MISRVRELTIDEVPFLMVKIKGFENCSCFVKIDIEYSAKQCWNHMSTKTGTVFGLFDRYGEIIGGLGCVKVPDIATGIMTAVETFWFVEPGKRGNGLSLMEAFEKWADENDCPRKAMIHLVDSHPESLERLYLASGYKLVEKHYVKGIADTVDTFIENPQRHERPEGTCQCL